MMMSTQEILKDYQLRDIFQFYDVIYTSWLNGNNGQAREQFRTMSLEQRKDCFKYLMLSDALQEQVVSFTCAVIIQGVD